MEEIFKIAGAIIVSFGGATTVLLGLSSFLSKIWINKLTEKDRAKHLKEIENLKSELTAGLKILEMNNEKAIFVTKLQYEKEFSIYLELWESVCNCTKYTLRLYPRGLVNVPVDETELEEFNKEKLDKFFESITKFEEILNKYAPFYDKEFDDILRLIRTDCIKIGNIFKTYTFDVKYNLTFASCRDMSISTEEWQEVHEILPKNIEDNTDILKNQIRSYLKRLQESQN